MLDLSHDRRDSLRRTASRFRRAIELAPPASLGASFEKFPRGACGDATLLLGTYLIERGEGEFDYVHGVRMERTGAAPREESHAWLQQNGVLVDITADQFSEYINEPVIVAPAPTPLHETFRRDIQHVADYRILDAHPTGELARVYSQITAMLGEADEGRHL